MNAKIWVPVSVVVVILAFVAGSFLTKKDKQVAATVRVSTQQEALVRAHAPTLGREGAQVVLVEFFDPECESCRFFHPYTKSLLQEYEGKIQIVFRYAPFHANSQQAIKILEAARVQNRYWETLDVLYQHQPEWGSHHNPRPELMWTYVAQVPGLDQAQLKKDYDRPETVDIIKQDQADAMALGVRMTPSFFVNGEPLTEFGYDQLKALIERHLQKQ